MKWSFVLPLLVSVGLLKGLELPLAEPCDARCQLPDCRCSSTDIPGGIRPADVPQFVLLTFDAAVSIVNVPTYRQVLYGRRNSNSCPIGASFYVSHEYTNYELVHELYSQGFEIGLNAISRPEQEYFRDADLERMNLEFADQKTQITHFAAIPGQSIQGMRIPFLQLAGNVSFQMMQSAGLKYDITWPTARFTNPGLWPYSLDYESIQDCASPPCPTASFPGIWIVPMITWTDLDGFPCATVESCFHLPGDEDENGWFRFILDNFNRHYLGNRSPFGLFIQEASIRTRPGLRSAFIRYLDMINSMSDVFMVNVSEMLDWVQKPVPLGEYINQPCRQVQATRCRASNCGPLEAPHTEELFYMPVCSLSCPSTYPWVGNPLGR